MWKLFTNKNNNTQSVKIKINGMHCTSCSLNVESALEELTGVVEAKASYAKGEVVVDYTNEIDLEKVYSTIDALGYKAVRVEQ